MDNAICLKSTKLSNAYFQQIYQDLQYCTYMCTHSKNLIPASRAVLKVPKKEVLTMEQLVGVVV